MTGHDKHTTTSTTATDLRSPTPATGRIGVSNADMNERLSALRVAREAPSPGAPKSGRSHRPSSPSEDRCPVAPIPTERQWTTDTGFREMPRGAAQDPDRQDVFEARRANALHAAEILEQNGYTSDGRNGTQRLRPNHTYVMQIDQAPPEGRLGGYASTYTGQTAVFRTNQDGHLEQVRESGIYASSSHPQPANRTPVERFGHNRVGSRDVDGNRTVDYPLLTRGMHEYHSRVSTDGREQYGLISGTHGCLVVPHDTNQDYRTQPDTDQRHHSYGLNIHAGGDTNLASTGCQNIRGPEFGSFRNAVTASTPSSETFTYVLASRPNVGSDFGDKHRAQEHAARRR